MPPTAARRTAAAAPPPVARAPFGSDAFYAGGFTLPEGDYAMEHNVVMHAGTKQDGTPAGQERLGVMLTAYPVRGGDPIQQFLSMGTKAHESWAPDPETGKGIVPIAGVTPVSLSNKSNWYYYKKSMEDCGLPEGIFVDDIATLDGIWVHTTQVPEPEERKNFGAKTGEVQEERKGGGKMVVVSAILDDGKPWEGTGGFDFTQAAAAPAKPAVRAPAKPAVAAARPAVKAPARVAAPVQEEAAPEVDQEALLTAAINGVSDVLSQPANAKGCTKLALRANVFKAISKQADEETGNQVMAEFFSSDEALNTLLGQVGFALQGAQVKPAA